MTRPRRASATKVRTRSPEPRREALWTVLERIIPGGLLLPTRVQEWTCEGCASGTGQAPTRALADQAAHAHWRANHNHYEEATP